MCIIINEIQIKNLKAMKTKQILIFSNLFLIALLFTFTSCKKEKEANIESLKQLVHDENRVTASDDDLMNDVNAVISGVGNKSMDAAPCNITVDSSTIISDTIIYDITFNGTTCNGIWNRQGHAKAKKHVSTHWIDAGATVYVTYYDVKFTRVSDGLSATLNGTKKFVNVNGGRISDLGSTATSIVHRVFGNLIATFDDNTNRTWKVARQRTFTGTAGNLICTVDGLGSESSYNSLVAWGINRSGENFYTQITQSVVYKETCSWNPCAGVKVHSIPSDNKKATFTAGFDNNDQPVPVNGTQCPTKYRIDWEKNGNSGTIFRFL